MAYIIVITYLDGTQYVDDTIYTPNNVGNAISMLLAVLSDVQSITINVIQH